jgi:hypothetical protein
MTSAEDLKQAEAREQLKADFDVGMQMLKLEYDNVIRDRRDVPGWPRLLKKSNTLTLITPGRRTRGLV